MSRDALITKLEEATEGSRVSVPVPDPIYRPIFDHRGKHVGYEFVNSADWFRAIDQQKEPKT